MSKVIDTQEKARYNHLRKLGCALLKGTAAEFDAKVCVTPCYYSRPPSSPDDFVFSAQVVVSNARKERRPLNTKAAKLWQLATIGQYGHSRHPSGYFMDGSYSSFYWHCSSTANVADHDDWKKVAAFSARYKRFYNYVTEIKPGWQVVETLAFADNSTEVVEVSKNGIKRQRMTLGPSGDACF